MKKIFSGIQPSGILHIGNYLGAIKQWVALQGDPAKIQSADPSVILPAHRSLGEGGSEMKNFSSSTPRSLRLEERMRDSAHIRGRSFTDAQDDNGEKALDDKGETLAMTGQMELIFCIVDLHAITVPQKPEELRENILRAAATYIACGIDPNKSKIFVQSSRAEHSELAWILNTITSMGELNRMTQFKDKSERQELVSVGLFDYPVLMAADILIYNADVVPVGEDQKQHVELARNIAGRFNNRFGETFVLPEPMIRKETARIMGLDDPTKKMSKSAVSPANYIALMDDAETIRQKISRATTDSGSGVKIDPGKPGISNLLSIYCAFAETTTERAQADFEGKTYSEFKTAVAEEIIEKLTPIQRKYQELRQDDAKLIDILRKGADDLAPYAQETISKVKSKVGLGV